MISLMNRQPITDLSVLLRHYVSTGAILAPLPTGCVALDDQQVAAWPLADPAAFAPDYPLSMCWSPIVRCNLACPQCLDDESVPGHQTHACGQCAGPGRRLTGVRGSRSRSGSRRPTPSAGCRGPGCRRRP
ncbi:hypothetical protein F7Q99_00025 [Streptomyces kaniharaensis]|uniref:Uncharacterized protein n=1 Tax=Streptomyces kaniharaensis TaxID=212423 RepID=A0A6N7KJG1_9ACTN|nr:hypothetical protein [Streptomyces kaniharaensis]